MFVLERIHGLPADAEPFFEEMATGIRAIYGERAEKGYRNVIRGQIEQAIAHPQVVTFAARTGDKTAGLCSSVIQDGKASIVLLHVLDQPAFSGLDAELAERMVEECRRFELDGIVYENIPLFPANVNQTFIGLGFAHLSRVLMNGPLSVTKSEPYQSRALSGADYPAAASILVDGYVGHGDRILHKEIRSQEAAVNLILNVESGSFGRCNRDYLRWIYDGEEPAGIILCCETVDGVGFVLQVVVRRSSQGRGLGRILLEEMKDIFLKKGLDTISLGVTEGNPAQHLYERCGMRRVKHIDSFAWWKESIETN